MPTKNHNSLILSLFKYTIIIASFIALSFIPYRRLVTVNGTLSVNEMIIPSDIKQFFAFINAGHSIWNPFSGQFNFDPSLTINLSVLFFPFSFFGFPGALFLVFVQLLATVSMFLCARRIVKNELGAYVGAIVYSLSPYFFNQVLADFYFIPYSFFPLAVLFIDKTFTERRLSYAVITGFIMSLLVGTAVPIFFEAAFVLLTWFFVKLLLTKGSDRGKLGRNLAIIIIVVIALNLYWLSPALVMGLSTGYVRPGIPYLANIQVVEFWSQFLSPLQAILQNSPGWFRTLMDQQGLSSLPLVALLVAVLPVLVLFKRNREILYFSVLYVISLGFAQGTWQPLVWPIYAYTLQSFQPFTAFNRPYFWMPLVVFSSVIMLAYLVSLVDKRARSARGGRMLVIFLAVMLVMSSFVRIYPVGTSGDFSGYMQIVPPRYDVTWQIIANQGPGKLLLLPANQVGGIWLNESQNRYLPFSNPFVIFPTHPFLSMYNGPPDDFLVNGLYLNRFGNISRVLASFGVKYVLVDTSQIVPFVNYQLNISGIVSRLERSGGVDLIYKKDGIYLFKIENALPLLFGSSKIALMFGDLSLIPFLDVFQNYTPLRIAPFFAGQLNCSSIERMLSNTDLVVIQGNNYEDLLACMHSNAIKLSLSAYANSSGNYHVSWLSREALRYSVWNEPYLPDLLYSWPGSWALSLSNGNNITMNIPFSVSKPGTYGLSLQVFVGWATYGQSRYSYSPATLTATLDGAKLTTIRPSCECPGEFRWVALGNVSLGSGSHSLSLSNLGGLAVVSSLLIRPLAQSDSNAQLNMSLLPSTLYVVTPTEFASGRFVFSNSAPYGLALELPSSQMTTASINVIKSSEYFLSFFASGGNASVDISVDGRTFTNLTINNETPQIYSVKGVWLNQGNHTLGLKTTGGHDAMLYSIYLFTSYGSFEEFLANIHPSNITSDAVAESYHLKGSGNSSKAYILMQPYDGMFEARAGNDKLALLPSLGGYNGFINTRQENSSISISYGLYPYYYLGVIVGLFAIISLIFFASYKIITMILRASRRRE